MIRPRQIIAEELSYLTINWKGEPASITTPRKVEIAPSTMGTNTCSMAFCILSFLFPSVCRKAWKWSGMEVIEGKIKNKFCFREIRERNGQKEKNWLRDLKWMWCHWVIKTKIIRLEDTKRSPVPGPVRTERRRLGTERDYANSPDKPDRWRLGTRLHKVTCRCNESRRQITSCVQVGRQVARHVAATK